VRQFTQIEIEVDMITFEVIEANGAIREVQANEGETLLQATLNAGIDGFAAECGGCCVCAPCHCYIDDDDLDKMSAPASDESQMLDFTATERRPSSRLACQIKLSSEHIGIKVHMPERQY
jgi:2Fe-2S ferredoxin